MIDQELSAAFALYGEASRSWWADWEEHKDVIRRPSVEDRFLAACDSPRARKLFARVKELIAEVVRVPDPGGDISGYNAAIRGWAESHPEIEHSSLAWLLDGLSKKAQVARALADVIDRELSAAFALYGEGSRSWRADLAAGKRMSELPSVEDRFLAACESPRAPELLARIKELIDEAERVPDPGGPIGGYIEATREWAESHPEIEFSAVSWLLTELAWAAR